MNTPDDRPSPDDLLRRMQADAARATRGKLKIFFGFAPGVGKTYRMLQVARELVAQHHTDVVVGLVEDHRRVETASMAQGLEHLPRLHVEYRGRTLEEFDLDAALGRKPQVLLLDELAHSNAPGSRHPKRYEDIIELLHAGIDVFTTMNVQHVESLNDVVAQITDIQVRETVPDSIVDQADAIELIDIAPEELLARLKAGKIYLPEQANRAAQHFFQRGNLLALRELALRRTAQHVDQDVREYRLEHGVAATWPAGERILVCVGPAPSSARLVRAAARMAAGLRCPWLACYVDVTASRTMLQADSERLEGHLRLAESLGATVTRLTGPTVSGALLRYCQRNNVTRVIIGKPTHSRLRDRLRGSLLDEIVRGSADTEVHVISGDTHGDKVTSAVEPPRYAPAVHYLYGALLVLLTLVLAIGLRRLFELPDPEMLFLVSVMLTAVWFGRGPSILAAGLGVACYDFVFVPPFNTFSVDDRRYFLTFGMMFGVSFVISELTGRLRKQERDAVSREERTAALYALSRELASAEHLPQIAAFACRHAAQSFDAEVTLLTPSEGELSIIGRAPDGALLDVKERGVAKWSFEHDAWAGLGTDTLPGAAVLSAPLRAGNARLGVLVLRLAQQTALRNDQRAFVDVFCRQVALALARVRLSEEAKNAALRAKTEEMRSSLLSAVSHDLRTPLASITGAATSLRDDAALSPDTKGELVESIVTEAERLERLVANLLDMTRLEAGSIQLRKDWVPLEEMIGSALTRLEKPLGERKVTVVVPDQVPLVLVDPVLFEQVFVNLLENAVKHTPPNTPIEVTARSDSARSDSARSDSARSDSARSDSARSDSARSDSARTIVEVSDRGGGLPPGAEARLFEKFYRGTAQTQTGAGLGLAICKGIVEAHGGEISAHRNSHGGATFRVSLRVEGTPPSIGVTEVIRD